MYDVAIIGAGIAGCSIARELAKYRLSTVLIEKDYDVANGTTKANSAIVHAGYDAKPGSLKAKFNALGNPMFDSLCRDLDVPFKRIGSLVLAFNQEEVATLEKLKDQSIINGIPGVKLLNREEVRSIEPNVSDAAAGALYAPTGGIVGPWELAIAMAENAAENGVQVLLESPVTGIVKTQQGFRINMKGKTLEAKYIVNCAGIHADEVHDMVGEPYFRILARKGEYDVFDKSAGKLVSHVIFQCPNEKGKGVLVTPSVSGNLLIGPNAQDMDDRNDLSTTAEGLDFVRKSAAKSLKALPSGAVINNFAGLRARSDRDDFIIEESRSAEGFINVAGIESPGLTAAPAIAVHVAELLGEKIGGLVPNPDFNPHRTFTVFHELQDEEKNELVKKDSRYGRIICRCEWITEGEIIDCIKRKVGATTVDGVKRRVRPGYGRCQGGFCGPRVMEILARELGKDITEIRKDAEGSYILTGETKTVRLNDGGGSDV